ncbi:MAG: tetratricopeptide repeat protein, partial [Thermoanaerobaculia bacterium]|nr:tetratricopeptide repeat protein [Thermoanaerobaculia bacterium]
MTPSRRRCGSVLTPVVVAVLAAACAGRDVAPPTPALPDSIARYLDSPLGPGSGASGAAGAEIAAAFEALRVDGDVAGALATADRILSGDPAHRAAALLGAQAEFAAGAVQAATDRLEPWIDDAPGFAAAQLLWARLAEQSG